MARGGVVFGVYCVQACVEIIWFTHTGRRCREERYKSFQLATSMIMTWPARIGSQYVTAKTVRSFTLGRSMIGEATGWCSCIEKGGVMQLRHAR